MSGLTARMLALGTALVLVAAGCSSPSDSTEASQPTSPSGGSTTPTTTAQERGTIDSPLPVDDATASGFSYAAGDGSSASWDGLVLGLVETGTHEFNDVEGRCLFLLGTLTPTALAEGLVSDGSATPPISMTIAGVSMDDGINECDLEEIKAAGYGWIRDAQVTVGTTFPFYSEFFLPGPDPAEPDVVTVGSASSDDATIYELTVLDALPSPGVVIGGSVLAGREALPVGDEVASGFGHTSSAGPPTDWDGFVFGLIETETHPRFNNDEGRCLLLLGALTPTALAEGLVSSAAAVPPISLVVAGVLVDDNRNECDTEAVEAAGYGWIREAEVAIGTTFPFYTEFFLPGDDPADPEVIVIGSAISDSATIYQPTVLDALP